MRKTLSLFIGLLLLGGCTAPNIEESTTVETTELVETVEAPPSIETIEKIEWTPVETETETEPIIETTSIVEETTFAPETFYEETAYYTEPEPEPETTANVIEDYGFYITYAEVDASVYSPYNVYGLSEYEVYLIAKIVEAEAGADYLCLEQKLLTACVVINLSNSPTFAPSTIEGVIYNPGTYYPVLAGYFDSVIPSARSLAVANYVANNGVICPPNVIYEANFTQGSGTYRWFYVPEQVDTYLYSYFCYE